MVRWKDRSGLTRLSPGKTRNISHSGALIICDSAISDGCEIDLRIELPLSLGGFMKSRVSATAKVVRNVPQPEANNGYGHGIMFHHFDFMRI